MPRRGGARPSDLDVGVRRAPSPVQVQPARPHRPPGVPAASAGPPSGPLRRHALGRAAVSATISAANSTARFPSGRGGPGLRAQPSPEPANLAGGCGPSRANRANRASSRRRSVAIRAGSTPDASVRSGHAVDSTTTSRSRTPSTRRPGRAARRTTRCRGCVIADLRTKTTAWNTARGHGHPSARPPGAAIRGTTTTDRRLVGSAPAQERGGRISRGSANTNVSLAVVTGCTVP